MYHRILIMVSVVVLCSGLAFGQAVQVGDQSSLLGRLTDNSNAGIARATVILSQPSGQTVGITTTNPGGEYVFRTMASGDYTIQATASTTGGTVTGTLSVSVLEDKAVHRQYLRSAPYQDDSQVLDRQEEFVRSAKRVRRR